MSDPAHVSATEPTRPRFGERFERWAPVLAVAIAALVLFSGLGRSGIWDPYELDGAELSRRIAVNVFGAEHLALPGAENRLPTLSDLGSGELGFTAMALGFRFFGLHDWAGRLPLSLAAFFAILVFGHLVGRLANKRAGLYAVIALASMPLFFLQARTMLGDGLTIAAVTVAFSGLFGLLLDDAAGLKARWAPWVKIGWLSVALLGLGAGYLARGVLIGVAVPSIGAGSGLVLLRYGAGRKLPLASLLAGLATLLLGLGALGYGVWLLKGLEPGGNLARSVGFLRVAKVSTESTFEMPLRDLGHALFPWSALLPLIVGRLFGGADDEPSKTKDFAVLLLVSGVVAYAVMAYVGPYSGPLPFPAPALLAGLLALSLGAFEGEKQPSRLLFFGSLLLAAVLLSDLIRFPETAMAAFSVEKPVFPKSFEGPSTTFLAVLFLLFVLGIMAFVDAPLQGEERNPKQRVMQRIADVRASYDTVAEAWGGNLLFSFIVLEAALVGLGAMVFFGKRFGWAAVGKLSNDFADVSVNLWWIVPIVVMLVLPLTLLGRDLVSLAASRLPSRASFFMIALAGTGAVSSFGYYPGLAEQLSPKEVFETYAAEGPGKPLGLLGVRSRAGAYYNAGDVETLKDGPTALTYLLKEPEERRFLVLKADELPRLNSLYRKAKGQNLPILDARSSEILLASNELGGRTNQSFLDAVVMKEPPAIDVPIDGSFEDELDTLGWDIRDKDGGKVSTLRSGTPYTIHLYYRVNVAIKETWKSFIHVDGYGRRHNGDHTVLDGKYPMTLWLPGDVIVDSYELVLEPNFTQGDYTLFYGFFQGDRRYEVTRGPTQENRIIGGILRVR